MFTRTAAFSISTLVLAAATMVSAQETPDVLTRHEWRCERQVARSSTDVSDDATDCLLECRQAAQTDPLRRCDTFFGGFDLTTQFCIENARTRPEIRALRRCGAEDCPECYFGGACGFATDQALDSAIFGSTLRVQQVACDDSASPDGLNSTEARCQERAADHADRLQNQLRKCFDACQGRRQAGRATEESCRTGSLLTGDADERLASCVHRARVRFLRSCVSCDDTPECWDDQFAEDFCPGLLAFEETLASQQENTLFCVDQPRCGDGFLSDSEQCEFTIFPSGCAPNEDCTSSCECERFPVCGDGEITGFELCDPSATPNGCNAGETCVNCNSCAPDVCDSVTTTPPSGGTFFGFTAGPDSTSGLCGGSGPEDVYEWTPASSGLAHVDTCGSSFDTMLYVRELSCDPFARELACNDDSDCGLQSRITFNVQAGTTYYVFVDGFGGDSGSYRLRIVPPSAYGSPQRAFLESSGNGLFD